LILGCICTPLHPTNDATGVNNMEILFKLNMRLGLINGGYDNINILFYKYIWEKKYNNFRVVLLSISISEQYRYLHIINTVKPLNSGHSRDRPNCPLLGKIDKIKCMYLCLKI